MATLGTLKAETAALFGLAVADFSVNGKDMLTSAINKAIRKAQLNHNFERTKVLVDLVVNGVTGGAFSAMKLHGTATSVELVNIIDIGPYDDTNVGIIPQTWMTYDEYKTRQVSNNAYEYDPEIRYPANERPTDSGVQWLVVGETLFQATPGQASDNTTVGLFGCQLVVPFADGTGSDSTENVFLKYGQDYIMWEAALLLNHMRKEWVPRTEGNLAPPEKMRSEAWNAFLAWDTFQYNKFPQGGL